VRGKAGLRCTALRDCGERGHGVIKVQVMCSADVRDANEKLGKESLLYCAVPRIS
jgi:hypothetical protein